MSTSKETAEYILDKLGDMTTFSVRSMFGEFALYAKGKTVGFICDDLLYVKIVPMSAALAESCEQGSPYPGAKLYYIVEDSQLDDVGLPALLIVADSLPAKKKKISSSRA